MYHYRKAYTYTEGFHTPVSLVNSICEALINSELWWKCLTQDVILWNQTQNHMVRKWNSMSASMCLPITKMNPSSPPLSPIFCPSFYSFTYWHETRMPYRIFNCAPHVVLTNSIACIMNCVTFRNVFVNDCVYMCGWMSFILPGSKYNMHPNTSKLNYLIVIIVFIWPVP